MLKIPDAIQRANFSATPAKFSWTEKLFDKLVFDDLKKSSLPLVDRLNEANYRTNLTLMVCMYEWFVRRFEGLLDLQDSYQRLEAAYACAINPFYLNSGKFKEFEVGKIEKLPSDNVLKGGISVIWDGLKSALSGRIGVAGKATRTALLCRHVIQNTDEFDVWLDAAIAKGTAFFPREVLSYDQKIGRYNYGVEKIVPREFFFDPAFEYNEKTATTVLQTFLNTLNPGENPYLCSAETMKADGYTREPYKLVDLRKG